jgi:uncharacterized membrane protein YeaQ/YmgE (transglycosylase-associated protein family)
MEIAFILVYGSLLGLMAPYIISGSENYGVLLPPALALIYGYFVWAVFTWVGLSYNEFWIWAITMLGMPVVMIVGIRIVRHRRLAKETVTV